MTEVNKRDLVVPRHFTAPLSLVWKAWSDPEDVRQWWGPEGFTSPLAQIDFHEGATSLVCMRSPEYGDHYSTWRYEKIVPLQRIEYIHNLADQDGKEVDPVSMGMPADFPQDQRHAVSFKDVGNGQTEMTVTEYDWTVGHMMEMSKLGLNQCLEKMAASFTRVEACLHMGGDSFLKRLHPCAKHALRRSREMPFEKRAAKNISAM